MPRFCASSVDAGCIARPSSRIWPWSGAYTPVSTLIKVDLPAPFWPISVCTSPGYRFNATPLNACTPGNALLMPRSSSTGAGAEVRMFIGSVFTVREFLGRDFGREHTFLSDDALRHRLASNDIARQLHQLRAQQRAALHGHIQLPGDHRLESTFDAIDGNHDDVLARLQARFLDGLDRADRHVIVVRIEHVDLLALGLEESLHHFLALGAGEVAGLRADHLQLRIAGDDFLETLLAVQRGRRTDGALQLNDIDNGIGSLLCALQQPAAGAAAFFDEVRSDE